MLPVSGNREAAINLALNFRLDGDETFSEALEKSVVKMPGGARTIEHHNRDLTLSAPDQKPSDRLFHVEMRC